MVYENILEDITISESECCNGGDFKSVNISRSGKIKGNLKCEKFNVSGDGKVFGNITSSNFKISKCGIVEGNVITDIFNISGCSRIYGNLKCNEGSISGCINVLKGVSATKFKLSGGGKFESYFKGQELIISGKCLINKGVEADYVNISGNVKINGMLNAERILINLSKNSYIEEIGATYIRIEDGCDKPNILGNFYKTLKNGNGRLKSQIIEGDEIYLENTNVEVVRGDKIIIGKGCEIKRIEYRQSYDKNDDSSKIGEVIRI